MTFTEKLDQLMEEKHLNKNSLSRACGIPYTTIDGWYKKGVSDLKLSTLKKLTAFFDLSLDYWLDDDIEEIKKSPAPEDAEEIKREKSYRLFDALVSAGLIRDDDLVADDIEFLFRMLDVIDVWFARKERK